MDSGHLGEMMRYDRASVESRVGAFVGRASSIALWRLSGRSMYNTFEDFYQALNVLFMARDHARYFRGGLKRCVLTLTSTMRIGLPVPPKENKSHCHGYEEFHIGVGVAKVFGFSAEQLTSRSASLMLVEAANHPSGLDRS